MLVDRECRARGRYRQQKREEREGRRRKRARVDVYRRRERVLNASLFRRRAEAGALGCCTAQPTTRRAHREGRLLGAAPR